jgi:hypothetical protein
MHQAGCRDQCCSFTGAGDMASHAVAGCMLADVMLGLCSGFGVCMAYVMASLRYLSTLANAGEPAGIDMQCCVLSWNMWTRVALCRTSCVG